MSKRNILLTIPAFTLLVLLLGTSNLMAELKTQESPTNISSSVPQSAPSILFQLDDNCLFGSCKTTCDCYWSADCSGSSSCDYGSGCTKSGKLDGTCKSSSGGFSPGTNYAAVFERLLGAYIKTAENDDDGLPNEELVLEAWSSDIPLQDYMVMHYAVYRALDITVGWDFFYPQESCLFYDNRCLGQFKIAPDPEGIELLKAVQAGFSRSLTTGSPIAIQDTLSAYWRDHEYIPHHMGRCYPHGHEDVPYDTVLDCQVEELTRLLEELTVQND